MSQRAEGRQTPDPARVEIPLFPKNKYEVVVSDPPWSFETFSEAGKGRSPERHYPTMSLEEICSLPVSEMVSDRAVLFLWVTWPTIFSYAPQVIDAWGFEYRARAFTWVKTTPRAADNLYKLLVRVVRREETVEDAVNFIREGFWHMGNGYYTRANDEACLLCVRKGKTKSQKVQNPVANKGVRSLIVEPLGEHSAKPDEFYRRVEALYPPRAGRRYLELFARRTRPGWVTLGNEVNGGMDIRAAMAQAMEEDTGRDSENTKPLTVVTSRPTVWF